MAESFSSHDREIELFYQAGSYEVRRQGSYVICGATGQKIAIEMLRYWDVENQCPFASAGIAFTQLDNK